jgi:Flp pilus assembly protein TadG
MGDTGAQSRPAAGTMARACRLFSCNRTRSERGATLVEFAIIAVPFLLLIFGIMEVGFVFWGTYELENATEDAARQIRTGKVATNGIDADGFKALVCGHVSLLAQCSSRLRLDVRSFSSFGQIAANQPAPLDAGGNLESNFTWNPGGPSSIVLVSTFYEWPLVNVLTSASLSNMGDGNRLLRASAAFKNEAWN